MIERSSLSCEENQNNSQLFSRARKIFPGGVHSPVRSFQNLDQDPHFFQKAKGNYLIDANSRSYIDFCLSFGPLILGHRPEKVSLALMEGILEGWTYGTVETKSLALGEYIFSHLQVPGMEKIRFMNSGTEAVMSAVRLARGVTKRDKIIKFNGCYHGHSDGLLIKSGSGAHYLSEASSQGIPKSIVQDTLVLELDDEESVEECFKLYGPQIACVLIEPLPLNSGMLIQRKAFLEFLRKITKAHQSLLIFDEVYTGFRSSFGGYSASIQITPDIICYGKIIGGGLPVGAITSQGHIMDHLAPLGGVYQAGTLSANPLSMIAGYETLREIQRINSSGTSFYGRLGEQTQNIVQVFRSWLESKPFPGAEEFTILCQESIFWFCPQQNTQKSPPRSFKDLPKNLMDSFIPLFRSLFQRGIYISPNPYEVNFTSYAMCEEENFLKELQGRLYS